MLSSICCCLRRPQIAPQNLERLERFVQPIDHEIDTEDRSYKVLAYVKSITNITNVELDKIIKLQGYATNFL
jgi:hypothetical protein